MTNIDDLLMLTFNEIDYNLLSTKDLAALALSEDMFIATSALTELLLQDKEKAASVAWTILSEEQGDHHLQASAIEVLFSANTQLGLRYIRQNLTSFDPYVRKIVEEIIAENQTVFQAELIDLIHKLKNELDYILQTESISRNMDLTYLPLVIEVETASLNLIDTISRLRIK